MYVSSAAQDLAMGRRAWARGIAQRPLATDPAAPPEAAEQLRQPTRRHSGPARRAAIGALLGCGLQRIALHLSRPHLGPGGAPATAPPRRQGWRGALAGAGGSPALAALIGLGAGLGWPGVPSVGRRAR